MTLRHRTYLGEARESYTVLGRYTYQDGKWRGSDGLPMREVLASSEREAIQNGEKLYRKFLKSKGLGKGWKNLQFHLDAVKSSELL